MNLFLRSARLCLLSVLLIATSSIAFSATIVSAGSGNWSATAWPNTGRTGTITTSTGSAAVVGVGTVFTTEISVGSIIKTTANVVIGTVLSVTDDTHLTLAANAASDNTGINFNFQGIGSGDIASIQGGHLITIDNAGAVCAALGGSGTGTGTWLVTFNPGSVLTVTGLVTIGDAVNVGSIDMMNGGTLRTGGFAIGIEGAIWTPGSGTVELTATNTLPATFLSLFNNLTISAGTTTAAADLTINGNVVTAAGSGIDAGEFTHSVAGNITNDGAFLTGPVGGGSMIILDGTSQQTITNGATGTGHIENLTVNNSGGGILLGSDITVFTNLVMTQGNIDLGGFQLALGSYFDKTGTLTHTSGIIIGAGSFLRWFPAGTVIADGSDAGLFPVGTTTNYNPLFVSIPVAGSGGTIAVAYNAASGTSTVNIIDGTSTIEVLQNSSWTLTTPGVPALPAITSGSYNFRAEGTGFGAVGDVNDLRLSLLASVTGTAGTNGGTITNPQVNRTGIPAADLYQAFFIGSVDATSTPLPITLLSFTATPVNASVKLAWETTSEINNDHFTIQRSRNAADWESIKVVPGAINSSVNVKYSEYDESPYQGLSYYRLQQTDRDGKTSFSPVVSVKIGQSASVSVYPNPASDHIWITTAGSGKLNVALYSNNGSRIDVPVTVDGNSARLDVGRLAAGTYFVHILQGSLSESRVVMITR
jgi:hypothetical protein